MKKPNYNLHEKVYDQLRTEGYEGWGGRSHENRMAGWVRAFDRLKAEGEFPEKTDKVLELGCGAGDVTLLFAQEGCQVTGIDISPTAVQWAKDKFKENKLDAEFLEGNVCEMADVDSGVFDWVVDANCSHCIIGADREKFFREISRVIKPRGSLFLSAMIGDPKDEMGQKYFDNESRCQMQGEIPTRYMPHEMDLISEVEGYGFTLKVKWVASNTWWNHLEAIFEKK